MNKIDFTQTGGFPFDQGTLDFLQSNTLLAGQSASLGGSLCILSGCTVAGTNVSNGYVAINGEILPFVGGTVDVKVIIVEAIDSLLYEDNISRAVRKTRHATFGDDGVTNFLWVNFKRNTPEGVLSRLERLERIASPFAGSGGMVLWKRPANEIPAGWTEVADWRGRLPLGYNPDDPEFNAVGAIGGNKTRQLTNDNLPKIRLTAVGHGGVNDDNNGGAAGYNPGSHVLLDVGKEDPDNVYIMNPYRIVVFIEYVGG